MSQPDVSQSDFRFSLRMAFAAVAIVACVVALIVDVDKRSKETQRARWLNEYIPGAMTELGINLRRYGGVKVFDDVSAKELGPWPPVSPVDDTGQPLSSWRLQVSPYVAMGGPPPKLDVNAKWDAPVNNDYVREMGGLFCLNGTRRDTTTHVFGLAGPGSAFDAMTVSHYSQLPSDTIVAMEVRDSNTQCMQPGDYNVTKLLSYTGRIGDHLHGLLPDRLHVLFADGEVWALSPDAPMTALHPFLTIAGAETHDRNQLLGPHRVR